MQMFSDKRKGHHEKYCDMRYIDCPLGCQKPIRFKDKEDHIQKDCVRRFQAM